MASKVDTRWFNAALADRKLSQRQLARLMGCDPASVHRLATGKRPMRLDEASALANLLGKPVREILDHMGLPVKEAAGVVPVCGWLDGVGEVHIEAEQDSDDIEHVPGQEGLPPNAFALRAQTAGTPLHLFDGWLYYVALPMPQGVAAEALGRYCLVELESGARLLRWIRRGYKAGTYNLDATAAPVLTNALVHAATPVLGIRPA